MAASYWVVLLLFLLTAAAALPNPCDSAGLPEEYLPSSNRGRRRGADGLSRLGKWESAVPTYALNWKQHRGTVEDLMKANSQGIYAEHDLLASWAAAVATADQEETNYLYTVIDDIKNFKANPCLPGRGCTHYNQVGYVFNSMTL